MLEIKENISLSDYTAFRIGGNARYFAFIKTEEDLKEAVDFANQNQLPLFVLGGGSNLLISDEGVDGLVIKMEIKGVEITDEVVPLAERSGVRGGTSGSNFQVTAGAGEIWDDLVKQCVEKDLYGIENLSYIPGNVGASVVQNIGAYGVEIKDVVDWVEVFDTKTKEIIKLTGKACQFSYRDSIFKKDEGKDLVVLRTALDLKKGGNLNLNYKDLENFSQESTLRELREAVIEIRKNKLPDWKTIGTAGSFFKNPIITEEQLNFLQIDFPEVPNHFLGEGQFKIPLAYLLDRLGWKGLKEGNVGVYEKQPLAIVNFGGSTSKEIKDLAERITIDIKEKTGLNIEPEVVMW